MNIYDILTKKKHGVALTKEEIDYVVKGYAKGVIPDYQISALLMAICINGMNDEETYNLTISMRDSGEILDLSMIDGIKVDKHSTGGVGDKVTLILSPMLASIGVKVAKMSGRGLGHTGGTIDKLESIKNFNTSLTREVFLNNVNSIGIALAGQTANLAPADKKIYALRDVTATVDCIPLIASSVMSKKLASGADAIVLDVKCGNGAFMKTEEEATKLAKAMVSIGKMAGKEITAVITDMNEPLGHYIGNGLEIIEVIESLKGNGPSDIMDVVYALGTKMAIYAKVAKDEEMALNLLKDSILSGKAYDKFKEFVEAQGGDLSYIEDMDKLCECEYVENVSFDMTGYISYVDTESIGRAVQLLGGGRATKDDIIDSSVGIIMKKKLGDYIDNNSIVFTIYANDVKKLEDARKVLSNVIMVNISNCTKSSTIKNVI